MESILVDAAEVARHLGQAKSSIYRLAATGAIRSYAAGPRMTGRRFDLSEVREDLRRVVRDGRGQQTLAAKEA